MATKRNEIPNDVMTKIARQHLGVETLETRRSDRLDFHEVAVWQIEAALRAAYEAGRASRK
jgi:hypothetical protein